MGWKVGTEGRECLVTWGGGRIETLSLWQMASQPWSGKGVPAQEWGQLGKQRVKQAGRG